MLTSLSAIGRCVCVPENVALDLKRGHKSIRGLINYCKNIKGFLLFTCNIPLVRNKQYIFGQIMESFNYLTIIKLC